MTDVIKPEAIPNDSGANEQVTLSKTEFQKLIEDRANDAQSKANMAKELAEQREKIRTLSQSPAEPVDVSKVVEAEFQRRDAENVKTTQETALANWLAAHQEFSQENDKDGIKFAAFQKALSRFYLAGIKTSDGYVEVLNDALRLSEQVEITNYPMPSYSSTPQGYPTARGTTPQQGLSQVEQKFVKNSMGGDVERYLKLKTKRPQYVDEMLKWQV